MTTTEPPPTSIARPWALICSHGRRAGRERVCLAYFVHTSSWGRIFYDFLVEGNGTKSKDRQHKFYAGQVWQSWSEQPSAEQVRAAMPRRGEPE
jgi:hypothetical protein